MVHFYIITYGVYIVLNIYFYSYFVLIILILFCKYYWYYESDAFRVAKFNFPPIHEDLGLASIWWKIENKKFIILMTHQNFCKVNRLEDNRRKLSFIWALQCRFKLEKARFVCLFVIKYAWKGIKNETLSDFFSTKTTNYVKPYLPFDSAQFSLPETYNAWWIW